MRMAQGWLVTFILLLIAMPALVRADVQYVYDNAGRVVQVIAQDGSSAQYVYDAAGNISAIKRFSAQQLALSAFNPGAAAPGAQVTIHGSGFSTTSGDNVVSFNGVAGTVISASINRLIVQVPSGAATGPISVSVGSASVSSVEDFIVTAVPVISSFSPAAADVGSSVTISGAHFNPVPNSTDVTLSGLSARITSLAATQIAVTVPPGANSAPLTVATPHGEATTTNKLIVTPAEIAAANVGATGEFVVGAAAQSMTVDGNKYGIFAFDATQGQYLSLQVASLMTVPSARAVYYVLYGPNNVRLASSHVLEGSAMSIHLPRIATTGTHLIAFTGASTSTFQINASLEENPVFDGSQAPLPVATIVPAQSKRYVIRASAGQDLGIGISDLTVAAGSGSVSFSVISPQGGNMGGQSCTLGAGARCGLSLVNLLAGDYLATVLAEPQVNFTFRVTSAVTGMLPLNAPFNLSLPNPGQFAMLSFVATQGQTLNLQVDSIVTTPSQPMHIAVRDPSGVEISASPPGTYTNLNAGTYTVQLSPYYGGIATARILLSGAVERPTDGTSANFSTVEPGQPLYFSFNATAGEDIGIGIWNLTVGAGSAGVTMGITTPSGGSLQGTTCSGSPAGGVCGLSLRNLPQTGRYQVSLVPNQTTMSFTLAFTHAVNNALTIGVPFNLSLPVHGQFAMLTFTASAGQSLTLDVSSVATQPSQSVYVAVYDANNAEIASRSVNDSGSGTLSLPNLAAGTYKIQLTPYYGGTASAVVRVY